MEGTLQRKKRRRHLEQPPADGRDEMNLAEFPIAALSDRLPADVKTLVFEDTIEDPRTREPVVRRLAISGSDRYGLPTALDDEIIVGLIQLTRRSGFESPTVYFSRYELIQTLGWSEEGKSYDRIETAINRWCGVTLYWDNAWWDKEEEAWVNVKFGIIDNALILDKVRYERKRKLGQVPLALSSFKWNEVIFRSFQAGNLKHLDMDLFRGLRSSVAKRLYRFLDKRFFHSDTWEFDLHRFAFEKIGLSRSYAKNAAKIREKLAPGIEELEASGYLEPLPPAERYVQLGRGVWKVVFVKRAAPKAVVEASVEPPLLAALRERGVGEKVARDLVQKFPPERISEKLELHDWLLARKDERIAKNPAGFLATAIRDDYPLPKGFETLAQRQSKARAKAERERAEFEERQAERLRLDKERAQRRACDEYLGTLGDNEKAQLEAEAIAQGAPDLVASYQRSQQLGGKFASYNLRELVYDYVVRTRLASGGAATGRD